MGFCLTQIVSEKTANLWPGENKSKNEYIYKINFKKDTMKPVLLFRLLLLLIAFHSQSAVHAASLNGRPLQTLAFGSCNHAHLPQPLWKLIESRNPDLFLWAGDVVYADTTDPAVMKRKYQQQLDHPGYQQFLDRVPVIGTWDDHDYGGNNIGKHNPIKRQAQDLFLDFLGESVDSPRRQRSGIYTSYTYGSGDNEVKVILLDTRFNKESLWVHRSDLLGREQWRWLENEFRNSTARVHLIVSSISVLSDPIPVVEDWIDHPVAHEKMFNLLDRHAVKGVAFLTGDRHFSAHLTRKVNGRRYHEFMSSGLTHYLRRKNASRFLRQYYRPQNTYFGRNFGLIDFDWDQSEPELRFRVYDTDNVERLSRRFRLQGNQWRSVATDR